MSTFWKVIVVIAVVGLVSWLIVSMKKPDAIPDTNQTTTHTESTDTTSGISSQDTSDTSLDQDLLTVDAKMNAADTDATSASQSDTPIAQTE